MNATAPRVWQALIGAGLLTAASCGDGGTPVNGGAGAAASGGAPSGEGGAAGFSGRPPGDAGASNAGGGAPAAGSGGFSCPQDEGRFESDALIHPGGLHKRSDLERMRYMVEAGIDPWKASFDELAGNTRASYDYDVRGDPSFTVVNRDGEHGADWESDATAAYLNALMWGITGDPRHAEKCIEIFNAWTNLVEVTGGGTEALNAGLFAWKMLEAAEIVKSTYEGWDTAERTAFSEMLVYPGYSTTEVPASLAPDNGTFYWRIYRGDPGRHGNQDLIAWRAMLIMGVFLDNRVMFDRALRYFKGQPHRPDDLEYPSGPSPAGSQTDDNEYFTTFQYVGSEGTTPDYGYNGVLEHYVWENGQTQEASRDQQHAFFGLGIASGMAEVAWNQGDDVYGMLDNRLLEGFEFTGRYNASFIASFPDQPEPWTPSGDEVIQRLDRTGRWFSKAINPYFESDFVELSRGDFADSRPVFEQPLAHYQGRMGLPSEAVLWTERARDVAIAESGYESVGFSLDHPGFGALTFRRPDGCPGDPISGFDEGLPVFAMNLLPGTVEAEHYDYFPASGEGRTYHDLSGGNASGLYRDDDVDVGCVADGELGLTNLETGEWLTYTVHVPSASSYDVTVSYSATTEASLGFSFGGAEALHEIALPSTGGVLATRTLPAVTLEAGVQALRVSVVAAASGFELNSIAVTTM